MSTAFSATDSPTSGSSALEACRRAFAGRLQTLALQIPPDEVGLPLRNEPALASRNEDQEVLARQEAVLRGERIARGR